MGKSPGKWIKTVLFGKKSSKSNLSKGKDSLKSEDEKEVLGSKAPTVDSVVSPPVFSQSASAPTDRSGGNSELEKINSTPRDGGGLIGSGKQDEDMQGTTQSVVLHDPERIKQEQAATRAQAAFRGYLARRAFRALRGIIRLQALIRGHLVRRQAIATLRCMHGIVKFQALVRGRSVRISDIGIGVHEKCRKTLEDAKCSASFGSNTSTSQRERLWANAFISKRFASSPNAMPLRLQYGLDEQNSAWSWLEIWSVSRIWEPLPQPKKVHSKSQTRPKRSVRRVPAANLDSGSIRSSSEPEKSKRIPRKASSRPVDPVQENPQNELEKVKRNLKKVSNSTTEIADTIEVQNEKLKHITTKASGSPDMGMVGTEVEKPRHTTSKASGSPAPHVPDLGMVELSEKTKKEVDAQMSKDLHGGSPLKSLAADDIVDELHDAHPVVDSPTVEESTGKEENGHVTNEEVFSKEVKTSNEKASKRRASFPAKQEYPENGSHNSPKLPSYMAATKSAKAKLRAQGTAKSGLDGAEQNGSARRHSLPSSKNGKLSSLSPRTQRLVQSSGKGGIKNDMSLLSSRDGNEKVVQVDWRR